MINYHENLEVSGEVRSINNMPENQLVQPRKQVQIASEVPNVTSNNILISYKFVGWTTDPNSSEIEYIPGGSYSFEEDTDLYAIWRVALSSMPWKRDAGYRSMYR